MIVTIPGSWQCRTSADCASRVPYCSKLGYCHGGTLPFDEAQLEIEDSQKNAAPDQRPIGYVNNNPRQGPTTLHSIIKVYFTL